MRGKWTDERLEDLNHRVDEGFRDVRAEIRALRTELHEFQVETNVRLDSLQRTMVQVAVTMTAGFLAGFGGLAALIATQL